MTDRSLIKAELQNLQKSLEAKADMCIGAGKMKVLSFANACSGALELLKEQDNCENCAIAIEDRQLVVRCKDCKWYKEGYDIDGKWFSRCDGSVRTYGHTKPDWFCADGERRSNA